MAAIKRVGFFHFGSNNKDDPIGSLEVEIAKCSEPELKDSLVVLPEAFNARGGFYQPNPNLDPHACSRLQALSTSRSITFVVGLIERIKGPNSAFLIDGAHSPVLLSHKQSSGWDCLYTPSPTDKTAAVLKGGIGMTALICDDACYTGHRDEGRTQILARVERLNAERNVLCIPAYMTITDSLGVAKLWAKSLTVVVANGCNLHPSVVLHGGGDLVSMRNRDENEIKLCDL